MNLEPGTTQSAQGMPRTANNPTLQPGSSHAPNVLGSGDHDVFADGNTTGSQTSSTERQVPNLPPEAHLNLSHTQSEHSEHVSARKYARSHDGHVRMSTRRMTFHDEKSSVRLTVRERLHTTIKSAEDARENCARNVLLYGWLLNIMIALQILLGAMTTAISAAVTTVRQAQISTAILGALSTLVASYLARARGSGEPDLSTLRVKNLEQFLRTANALQLDHGHEYPNSGNRLGEEVDHLRHRFEELLGNTSVARKRSPGSTTPAQPESV